MRKLSCIVGFCLLISLCPLATASDTQSSCAGDACDASGSVLLQRSTAREKAALAADQAAAPVLRGLSLVHDAVDEGYADLPLAALAALEEASRTRPAREEADVDCADEVVLRLAISDSFLGKSYEQCVEETHAATFAKGGSGETLMGDPGSGGSGLTHEEVVARVRSRCITRMGHGIALGPRLVRMTFHDAADFDNLLFPNGTVAEGMGAVDSCLHTALLSTGLTQEGDDDDLEAVANGDPNHNRGLNNAERWVMRMATEGMVSRPDVQVLGAVVALEAWMDGPELGASFGRKRGHCSKIVCSSEKCWGADTPFFRQPVAEPVGGGMFCPLTNTLEPLRKIMGLSLEELVALQGSHSVGGVIVCSGLGNVASGPYCPGKCGIPPGDFFENGNLDGTAFDDTPGKFDNRYYQLLMNETYEDLPTCKDVSKVFPQLSKRGLAHAGNASVGGSGGGGNVKDRSEQCQQGVRYEPESMCEVEACVENCTLQPECVEAENTDDDDHGAYREAWAVCNECKEMCSSHHRSAMAISRAREHKTACRANCTMSSACTSTAGFKGRTCNANCTALYNDCVEDNDVKDFSYTACRKPCKATFVECRKPYLQQRGSVRRNGILTCKEAKKTCDADCSVKSKKLKDCRDNTRAPCRNACKSKAALASQCRDCRTSCTTSSEELADEIVGASEVELRPARWCKRLNPVKKCLDADIKMPINGGWGDCPEEKRVTFPNVGQDRLTIIQNLERWTSFRGLNKRVMVLPSDWSYLGNPDTKALYVQYGTDQDLWHKEFVKAWSKLSTLGWQDSLQTCTPVPCTVSNGVVTCSVRPVGVGNPTNPKVKVKMDQARNVSGLGPFVRPETLEFEMAKCQPAYTGSSTSCELIGGFGVKAKVSCDDGWVGYCSTPQIEEAEALIAEEWKDGGKTPMCTSEAS